MGNWEIVRLSISSRFLTMKEQEIGKTKGTLVFPISYSFMVKKQLEIERQKTCGPYTVSQITTLSFFSLSDPRGPESASIEIPPFRLHFINFSKTVSYEILIHKLLGYQGLVKILMITLVFSPKQHLALNVHMTVDTDALVLSSLNHHGKICLTQTTFHLEILLCKDFEQHHNQYCRTKK